MPDQSLVLAALARAAAQADGHGPCGDFRVQPGGLLACACGRFTYAVGRPVTGTEAAA